MKKSKIMGCLSLVMLGFLGGSNALGKMTKVINNNNNNTNNNPVISADPSQDGAGYEFFSGPGQDGAGYEFF